MKRLVTIDCLLMVVVFVFAGIGATFLCLSPVWWGWYVSTLDFRNWSAWAWIGILVVLGEGLLLIRCWPDRRRRNINVDRMDSRDCGQEEEYAHAKESKQRTLLATTLAAMMLAGLGVDKVRAQSNVATPLEVFESAPRDFAEYFEARIYHNPLEPGGNNVIKYRLFVPRVIENGKRYPLLVWLHGASWFGSENWHHLTHLDLVLDDVMHLEKYRFFILAVQCPMEHPAWMAKIDAANGDADMLTVAEAILQKTIEECPVDRNRLCLFGASAGGTACWEMAARYPNRYAAVVPMSSDGGDPSRAQRLTATPIWAFHNSDDCNIPANGDKEMVAAIQVAGGNAHLTLRPSTSHNSWTFAFEEHRILAWMLAQRRDSSICWTPAGCHAWQWWHLLTVPCICLGLIRWACWRRQRRLATYSADSMGIQKQ